MKRLFLFILILTCVGYGQFPSFIINPKFPNYQQLDTIAVSNYVIPLFTNPVWAEITDPDPVTLTLTLNPSCIDTVNSADSISIVFRTTNAVSGFLTTDETDTVYGVTMDSVFNDSAIGLTEYGVYFGNTWADTAATVTAYITFFLDGVEDANVQTLVRAFTIPRADDVTITALSEDAGHDTVFFNISSYTGGITGLTSDTYIYIRPYCINEEVFWADSVGGDYSNWSGSPEGYDDIALDSTAVAGDSLVIQQRILIWHDPTVNWRTQWRTISDTLVFDLTGPPAGTLIASGVNYDSLNLVSDVVIESGASSMARYAFGSYPADTSGGTLLFGWRTYEDVDTTMGLGVVTQDTLVYVRVFHRDSLINLTYSSDTALVQVDDVAPSQIVSVTADTNGTDSVDVTIVYGTAEHDSVRVQWNDSTITSRTYGTNILAGHDTTNVVRFAHGLTDQDTLYIKVYLADSLGNFNTGTQDTLVVPDMWSPVAGAFNQAVKPIGMDTLSISSFGGTADLASVYLDLWSGSAWVNVYSGADSSVDTTIENSAVNSVPFNPDSTLRARLRLYDEAGNYSAAYDTTNDDSARTVTIVSDTARSVVQALRIFTSADSNGTKTDSCYVLKMDTTAGADTIAVKVYSPTDTLWYAARPKIAGAWGTIGAWYKFPNLPADQTPPDTAGVFTATASDSTGITIIMTGFPEAPDSIRIQYSDTGYVSGRTVGTNLYAGSDSAAVNSDNFTGLNLTCNTTYYVSGFIGDASNNWTTVANKDTIATVACDVTAPDTAGVFTATASDSTGITIVWTGFPEVDSLRVQYSDTGYVSGRTVGTNLIATIDTTAVNNDLIAANLVCNTQYYVSGFVGDVNNNWTAVANLDTIMTPTCPDITAPDTADVFTATSVDSTAINVVMTGFTEAPDSIRIQYATGSYPANRTAGTNLYAGSDTTAVNNDNIAKDLVCNTVYYVAAFLGDAADNWTAVANKDTCLTAACGSNPVVPAWADSALFAWDGKYEAGDSTTAWADSGASTVAGVMTGGVFASSGDTVYFVFNSDNDELQWVIDSTIVNIDNPAGYTIWTEINIRTAALNVAFWELEGNASNFVMGYFNATPDLFAWWQASSDYVTRGSGVADSTWLSVGISWDLGGNPDFAIYYGGLWAEENDDQTNFAVAVDAIRLGSDLWASGAGVFWVRKFCVLAGWQTACPW